MKIAMLAPPYLPVPPPKYGGTEKIVSLLTEGLVLRGHDVTLFASGDSKTTAKLSALYPKAVGNSGFKKTDHGISLAQYRDCYARASEFDIIHSHGQYDSLADAKGLKTPVVFTWHGSFYPGENTEAKRALLKTYKDYNYVSISDNQRGGIPELHYVATVYNAIDIRQYSFDHKGQNTQTRDPYLLWVGRVSPKKGALEAIDVAAKAGMRLEIAAAIDPIDRAYFDAQILPRIDGKQVIFHGEIGHEALVELYGGAYATLYPISWHEPFGLVMAESMACGTPVIAFRAGSVPELVKNGLNGFVIDVDDGIDGMVEAVSRIQEIDRMTCRAYAEKHFHKDRMVDEYAAVYETLIREKKS